MTYNAKKYGKQQGRDHISLTSVVVVASATRTTTSAALLEQALRLATWFETEKVEAPAWQGAKITQIVAISIISVRSLLFTLCSPCTSHLLYVVVIRSHFAKLNWVGKLLLGYLRRESSIWLCKSMKVNVTSFSGHNRVKKHDCNHFSDTIEQSLIYII